MPTVYFDLRGKSAGMARLGDWSISLNAVLLNENPDVVATQTTIHELAHLVTHAVYGVEASAHGTEWKGVMLALGAKPERAHSLDVSNATVGARVYRYRCACKEHVLSARRHGKASRTEYVCKKCEMTLVYANEVRVDGQWQPDMRVVLGAARQPTTSTLRVLAVAPGRVPGLGAGAALTGRSVVASPSKATPVAPPAVEPDTPSEAQVRYALNLSACTGRVLTKAELSSKAFLSSFIAEMVDRKHSAPPALEAPTERQTAYARDIARRKGLLLGPEVLASRKNLSQWIDAHR